MIGEAEGRTESRMVYDTEKKMHVQEIMKENVWLGTNSALAQLVKFYGITNDEEFLSFRE
jgi:hypothetical protein